MSNSTSVSSPIVSSLTWITSSEFSIKMSLTLAMKCSSILLMMDAERDWLESEEETEEFKNSAMSLGLSYLISCLLYLAWILSVYLLGMRRGLNQSSLAFLQEFASCPSDKCSSNRFSKGTQLRRYLLDLEAERVRCGSALSGSEGRYFSLKSWDLLMLQSLLCTPLALICRSFDALSTGFYLTTGYQCFLHPLEQTIAFCWYNFVVILLVSTISNFLMLDSFALISLDKFYN